MPKISSLYSRVTSVLSFIDSEWYKWWLRGLSKICPNPFAEAERISKESAEFGTHVHKIVENWLLFKEPETIYTVRENECAGYIIQWLKETKAEIIIIDDKPSVEFEVKSEKLKLIGHFDAVVKIDGILWILDFKTSSKIRKSFALQKAAYCKMLEEEFGIIVNDGVTLRIDRDPSVKKQFEVAEYHSLKEKYWPVFEAALMVYSYFNGKGIWSKNKEK